MSINPNDITFVIQGPLGTTIDKKVHLVDGKSTQARVIPEKVIERAISNIRLLYPGAKILLSTWEGQDASDLDYDALHFSKDPGPNITRYERDDEPAYENMNRQIVSTINGLRQVKTKYAVKLRSDNILHSDKMLELYDYFPKRSEKFRFTKDRILSSNMWAQEYAGGFPMPYFVSDFFHFGRTEDLIDLWSVDLESDYTVRSSLSGHRQYSEYPWPRICVEQKLFSSFLKKHTNIDFRHKHDIFRGNKTLSDHCIANNLIIVEAELLGLEVLERTKQENDHSGRFYSHLRWQQLYQRHCDSEFENKQLDSFEKKYRMTRVLRFFQKGYKALFRLLRCKAQSLFINTPNTKPRS